MSLLRNFGKQILDGYSAAGRCQLGQCHCVADRVSTRTERIVGRIIVGLSILGFAATFLWAIGELHW